MGQAMSRVNTLSHRRVTVARAEDGSAIAHEDIGYGEFLLLADKNHVTALLDTDTVLAAVDDFLTRTAAWHKDLS